MLKSIFETPVQSSIAWKDIELMLVAEIFSGEVINTKDVITFQADTAHELKQAFVDSIEDYLKFCRERNEAPEKPFSGKFNLRVPPELHREAYIAAKQSGQSLNAWVCDILKQAL